MYKIQCTAPKPHKIARPKWLKVPPDEVYGDEYWGVLDHKQAQEKLLDKPDGAYLIRKSPSSNEFYTLTMKFNGKVKHYKVFYKASFGHYLEEVTKTFDTLEQLVTDSLISLHIQLYAAPILLDIMSQGKACYEESPYMTLNRTKLKAISGTMRKKRIDNRASISTQMMLQNEIAQESFLRSIAMEEPLPPVYYKTHNFKSRNFKGLNWCELCANFLWGFTKQGVKCESCGFIAHHKCGERVPPKCVPDLKKIRGVFGTDLTTATEFLGEQIPFVVRKCAEEVERRGLNQEGIYRVSGFSEEIESLRMSLDKNGTATQTSDKTYKDIHVVAGTLKLYLRLLPIPVITMQAHPALIEAAATGELDKELAQQVDDVKTALDLLPIAHYNCLKFIIQHLKRVTDHQAINKMTPHNLATVFAPSLIESPPQLTDLSQEIALLTFMIANSDAIYGSSVSSCR